MQGSKNNLIEFLSELNAKHPTTKFEFEISKRKITFLDTELYIENKKLYAHIYRKETDKQKFHNINSEHQHQ